mgnify:CR=1 FL=1
MNRPAENSIRKGKATAPFYAAAVALQARLASLSYEALPHEDGLREEIILKDGRTGTIDVFVERREGECLCVVVQGFLPGKLLWFIRHAYVDGFRMLKGGTVVELESDQLYGYD